ncbi:carboxypeptidase regulatory-like domain-containing protein [candidate division KSB1 bacterium]|nr:carboxypeptidase regulatory-like domain-containing protein [candidate division KSB1 bacterium]
MKIISCIFMRYFVLLILFLTFNEALAIDVTLPNREQSPGKDIDIPIMVSDVAGQNILSYEFNLMFNPAILIAKGITIDGTLSQNWKNPSVVISDGAVKVKSEGTTALNGTGMLLILNFQVKPAASPGNSSQLTFLNFKFNNGTPTADTQNGTFFVIHDTEPPKILTGPSISQTTANSVLITWETDEPSNSVVEYGLTENFGLSKSENALSLKHQVKITGLEPAQKYYYRVKSTDAYNNGPVSSPMGIFNTSKIILSLPEIGKDPGAEVIIPISISDISGLGITQFGTMIQFNTDLLTFARFSSEECLTAFWRLPEYSVNSGQVTFSINGSAPLTGGGKLINLHFDVNAKARLGAYNALTFKNTVLNSGAILTTTQNGRFVVRDTHAPQLVVQPYFEKITASTVVIRWETDELANSRIQYGEEPNVYLHEKTSSYRVKDHWILVTGLKPETRYYFKIASFDSSGNGPVESNESSFTTIEREPFAVKLDTLRVDVGNHTIPVHFASTPTSDISKWFCAIKFDPEYVTIKGISKGGTIIQNWPEPRFQVKGDLALIQASGGTYMKDSGKLIFLEIAVTNPAGRKVNTELEIQEFTLNEGFPIVSVQNGLLRLKGVDDTAAPKITFGPVVDNISSNMASVFWLTDLPATSQVQFGTGQNYGNSEHNGQFVTTHLVNINGLVANSTYHYIVASAGENGGNPAVSSDGTFRTTGGNEVRLNIPDQFEPLGAGFKLPIKITELKGQAVKQIQFQLHYDVNKFFAGIVSTSGSVVENWGAPIFQDNKELGILDIKLNGSTALADTGKILTVQFEILKNKAQIGEVIPVYFADVKINNGNIPVTYHLGTVTVKDGVAPTLIDVPTVELYAPTTAVIYWETSEPTTSYLEYYSINREPGVLRSDLLSTGHIFKLTDLVPGNKINYSIGAFDAAGNGGVKIKSGEFYTQNRQELILSLPSIGYDVGESFFLPVQLDNPANGNTYSIYTADLILKYDTRILRFNYPTGVGTITRDWNIRAEHLTDSSLAIQLKGNWKTQQEGILVNLNFTPFNPRSYDVRTALQLVQARINESTEKVQTIDGYFTTRKRSAPKFVIGPGAIEIHKNSVKIFWVSDLPTTGVIDYGLDTNYGFSLPYSKLETYHEMEIFGLQAATTYHFQVKMTTPSGSGPIVSSDLTFKTSAGYEVDAFVSDTTFGMGKSFTLPVTVQNVQNKNIRQFEITIAFDSTLISPGGISLERTLAKNWELKIHRVTPTLINASATGSVELRNQGRLLDIQGVARETSEAGKKSPVIISDLAFNYRLIPGSTRSAFISIQDQSIPEFVQNPYVRRTYSRGASIEWKTSEPTRAILMYGPDSLLENSQQIETLRTEHSIWVANLEPNIIYAFRVGIFDSRGNGPAWSPISYFSLNPEPLILSTPDASLVIGRLHDIPVRINGLAGETISDYQLTLKFDSGILVPMGIRTQNSLTSEWKAPEFSTAKETLTISHKGTQPIREDGVLFWATFMAHPKAEGGTQGNLLISDILMNSKIDTFLAGTAKISLTKAQPPEPIKVIVPDTSLQPGAWCLLPIRVSNLGYRGIIQGEIELTYPPSLVSCGGVVRAGKILSAETSIQEQISKDRIRIKFESISTISGGGTLLRILFKVNPAANIGMSGGFYLEKIGFNSNFLPVDSNDGSVIIIQWKDLISGFVVEQDSINPVSGATVVLKGENHTFTQTTTTDKIGRFVFAGLDTSQQKTYQLSASKDGYSNSEMITGKRAGRELIRLILLSPDGVIDGKITTPAGFPVHSAQVTVTDSKGNGPGHYAAARSDLEGKFRLEKLNRTEPFKLIFQKEGFKSLVLNQIFADSSLWLVPDAYFSKISGMIRNGEGAPISDVMISLVDTMNRMVYDSVKTFETGGYEFKNVVNGSYRIEYKKSGFLPVQQFMTIKIEPEQNYTYDFKMDRAIPARFDIIGPKLISNQIRTRYKYTVWSTTGQKMSLDELPIWSIQPRAAGSMIDGAFWPDNRFFGAATIAIQASNGRKDSVKVIIYGPVSPGFKGVLQDFNGFSLEILENSVSKEVNLFISDASVPDSPGAHTWKSRGRIYNLQPSDLKFEKPVLMTFPVSVNPDSFDLRLGFWETAYRQWQILPDVKLISSRTMQVPISQGGIYSLLDASEALALYDIRLIPNPFSTEIDSDKDGEPGLAIHFVPSSEKTSRPLVTLKIYNLMGELVRELVVKEPMDKAYPTMVRWDGRTDHQYMARNGRYLLQMVIEDNTGKKEYLKSIILAK